MKSVVVAARNGGLPKRYAPLAINIAYYEGNV
jgi:hypothetical protein